MSHSENRTKKTTVAAKGLREIEREPPTAHGPSVWRTLYPCKPANTDLQPYSQFPGDFFVVDGASQRI